MRDDLSVFDLWQEHKNGKKNKWTMTISEIQLSVVNRLKSNKSIWLPYCCANKSFVRPLAVRWRPCSLWVRKKTLAGLTKHVLAFPFHLSVHTLFFARTSSIFAESWRGVVRFMAYRWMVCLCVWGAGGKTIWRLAVSVITAVIVSGRVVLVVVAL